MILVVRLGQLTDIYIFFQDPIWTTQPKKSKALEAGVVDEIPPGTPEYCVTRSINSVDFAVMTPEPLLTTTQIDTETGRKCRLNKI
jgi:hypothetical protein